MNTKISDNLRKWICLLTAIGLYYLLHEGSHVICACLYGVFENVCFLGLGVQVVIRDAGMTDFQLAVFCLAGSIATLLSGWILVGLTDKIVGSPSKYCKAIGYYATLVLLLLDPVYLSVLYRFFGGGDMNGIVLLGVPEILIQGICALIGAVNLAAFCKMVYPKYKQAFSQT